MTEEQKPLEEGTPPAESAPPKTDRMAKARAAKAAKAKSGTKSAPKQNDAVLAALIERMAARIALLEQENHDRVAGLDVEITTATPGAPRQPGTYVQVGPLDKPNLQKVRWTKDDAERLFKMVDFIPEQGMTVSWQGLKYDLVRRVKVHVPSFVQDLHDAEVYRLDHMNDAYRPVSLAEHAAAAQRAMENPGVPIWTRLAIIPGGGLDMGEPAEAATAKPA